MRFKNIQELRSRKEELKAEITEMESILSFKNPKKTFGVVTGGISEKYLGNILASKLADKLLPMAGVLLGSSLKLGSARLFNNVVKRNLTKSVITRGVMGLGILALTPFLLRKIRNKMDDFQRREVAKSMSKLL